jgi:hypothetical protein
VFEEIASALVVFRNLLDSDPPLHVGFPVKVSVTDRSGNTWHVSFDAAELPSLG